MNRQPPHGLADIVAFFGDPSHVVAAGTPEEHVWAASILTQITLPKPLMGGKQIHLMCHRLVAADLTAVLREFYDGGLWPLIHTIESYCFRMSRTTHRLSTHCLPATETVWTTEGPARIAELRGFYGSTWSFSDGSCIAKPVSAFFENGRKTILRLRMLGHEMRCTPDHPVLVMRKHTLPLGEWIQHDVGRGQQRAVYSTEMVSAGNLAPGDRIVFARDIPSRSLRGGGDGEEWAEIVGLFLGDGCIHHRHGARQFVSFCFPPGDRVRQHVIDLMTKYFGEAPHPMGHQLSYYKERIRRRFDHMDAGSHDKRIPTEAWGWDREEKRRLMLGLLHSDGTVAKGGAVIFKFVSRRLVEDIAMLGVSIGMKPTAIDTVPAEDRIILGIRTHSAESYRVAFRDTDRVLMPTADPIYARRLSNAKPNGYTSHAFGYEGLGPDFIHRKLLSIESDGVSEVFDITVDDTHNFLVGGAVVSNCWGIAMDINAATNPLGSHGDMDPRIVAGFQGHKWVPGAHWPTPDPMHFQFATGY